MGITDSQAYKILGERADALAKDPEIQKIMTSLGKKKGKEYAEKYLYRMAILTLITE